MLEHSGGSPTESALLEFPGNETLQLRLNVQNTGQGHATVFSRLIGERLGIAPEKIPHRHGNSSNELPGYASVGSRSAMTVSHSVVKAIDAILAKGKPIAATMLEAGEADIAYKERRVRSRRHRPPAYRCSRSRLMLPRWKSNVDRLKPLTGPLSDHLFKEGDDPSASSSSSSQTPSAAT